MAAPVPLADLPLIFGLVLGVSLAAPPGPIMALMAQQSAASWTRGFLTGMAAMLADLLFFLLMWQGVLRVLTDPRVLGVLSLLGGGLMLWFARGSWRARERPLDAPPDTTFLGAFVIALTNPYQISWWATFGLSLLADLGVAVMVGFFAGIVLYVAFFSSAVRFGSRRFRDLPRYVAVASAVLLVVFAGYAFWHGAALLGLG